MPSHYEGRIGGGGFPGFTRQTHQTVNPNSAQSIMSRGQTKGMPQFNPAHLSGPNSVFTQAAQLNRQPTPTATNGQRPAQPRQTFEDRIASIGDMISRLDAFLGNDTLQTPAAPSGYGPPGTGGGSSSGASAPGGVAHKTGGAIVNKPAPTASNAPAPTGPGNVGAGYNPFTGQFGYNNDYTYDMGRFIAGAGTENPLDMLHKPKPATVMDSIREQVRGFLGLQDQWQPPDHSLVQDMLTGPRRSPFAQTHR